MGDFWIASPFVPHGSQWRNTVYILTFHVIAGLTRNLLARLRCLQEIPASAGMTKWGNGMTKWSS